MNIVFKKSPNFTSGRRGYKPELIVCHITEGSYAGSVSWLCNKDSESSAHYVVSRKGEITQLVDLSNYAWCNGTSTTKSKGNYYGKSTNSIVKAKKTNANYYSVSIELEGTSVTTAGTLTNAQYDALVWLIKHIQSEVKRIYGHTIPFDRTHIIGHNEVAPVTKPYCPGVNFPWAALMASLNPKTTAVTASKDGLRVDTTPMAITKDGKTTKREVYRVLYNGTNFLKLRDICGIAGAEVGYTTRPSVNVSVATNPTITLATDSIVSKMVIDVIHNGLTKQVAVNSILLDGTNYVKMRDVCAVLGATVGYNAATNLPMITLP